MMIPVESIEDRFNALYDYEVLHMTAGKIKWKYKVSELTVIAWIHGKDIFLKRIKAIVKIVDSGKFKYFFPEDEMENGKLCCQTCCRKRRRKPELVLLHCSCKQEELLQKLSPFC